MKVIELNIIGTSGGNKRPVSGYAGFDDGRSYDWMVLPCGSIKFYFNRSTHGGTGNSIVSFISPARAKALMAAFS